MAGLVKPHTLSQLVKKQSWYYTTITYSIGNRSDYNVVLVCIFFVNHNTTSDFM